LPLQAGDGLQKDSWGRGLQIEVNRVVEGDQVTVRSAGHDGELNTFDDIVAIRTRRDQAEAMGEELVGRLLDMAKKKAGDKLKELKE
jgi:hypothetical protein